MICYFCLKITSIKPNTFPGAVASRRKPKVLLKGSESCGPCGSASRPTLLQSYSVELINLLYTVHQGSQCYCVVQSLSVQVVLPNQHHWCGGGERMQRQAGQFIGVILHLVLAARVKLPGDPIEGTAGQAQHTSGQGDVVGVIQGQCQWGEEAGSASQHGRLV